MYSFKHVLIQAGVWCTTVFVIPVTTITWQEIPTHMRKIINTTETKVWFEYVREFLFLTLNNFQISSRKFDSALERQFKYSGTFLHHSLDKIDINSTMKRITVKKLSGVMVNVFPQNFDCDARHKKWKACDFSSVDVHYKFVWKFHLDKNMRLNLTFIELSFSSGEQDCKNGNLRVFENLTSSHTFYYCGQHPVFGLYPSFSNVLIQLSTSYFTLVQHKVVAEFVSFDRDCVVSHHSTTFGFPSAKQLSVITLRNRITIYHYLVQTKKIYCLVAHVHPELLNHAVVFDGPGSLSEIAEYSGSRFELSSFQCLAKVTVLPHKICVATQFSFTSVSKKQITSLRVTSNSNQSFKISSIDHDAVKVGPFIASLHSEHDHQINVTVTHLHYLGTESQTCQYGGFVTGQHFGDRYKESIPLCKVHGGTKMSNRHFYSDNSSLLIVVFWYKHYSSINISIMATQTKCKALQICPCAYNYYCHPYTLSESCRNYIESVNQANISINRKTDYVPPEAESESHFMYFMINLADEECLVVQFHPNGTDYLNDPGDSCKMSFVDSPIFVSGKEHHYQILGSFEPVLSHMGPHKCHSLVNFMKDSCSLRESFSVQKGDLANLKCLAENATIYRQEEYFNRFSFFITDKTKSPTRLCGFSFDVRLHPHRKSWIDMQLVRTVSETQSEITYITQKLQLNDSVSFASIYALKEHSVLLSLDQEKCSNTNAIRLDLTIFLNPGKYPPYRFHYDQVNELFHWSNELLFRCNTEHLVSLSGKMYEMGVEPMKSNGLDGETLVVKWIHDAFNTFSYTSYSHAFSCNASTDTFITGVCLNFSSANQFGRYYVILGKISTIKNIEFDSDFMVSWKGGSAICEEIGGDLPYFTNKEEQDELVALMKLSPDVYPMEALFIGLAGVDTQKVKSSHKNLCIKSYSTPCAGSPFSC